MLPARHEVVTKGATEGEITHTEVGNIGIETEAAYRRRVTKQAQKPKPKL